MKTKILSYIWQGFITSLFLFGIMYAAGSISDFTWNDGNWAVSNGDAISADWYTKVNKAFDPATWKAKNAIHSDTSDTVGSLSASDISSWLSAAGWSSASTDMYVAYWNTSCATGYTKAYDWILTALWSNGASSYTNVQWNIWAQASMTIICDWKDRSLNNNTDTTPSSAYAFQSMTNDATYKNNMTCAVCLK